MDEDEDEHFSTWPTAQRTARGKDVFAKRVRFEESQAITTEQMCRTVRLWPETDRRKHTPDPVASTISAA